MALPKFSLCSLSAPGRPWIIYHAICWLFPLSRSHQGRRLNLYKQSGTPNALMSPESGCNSIKKKAVLKSVLEKTSA